MVSFAYFLFMVPYQLALEYDIYEDGGMGCVVADVVFASVFLVDMILRSKLAFVIN